MLLQLSPQKSRYTPKIHTAGNFPAPSQFRHPTKPQESTLPGLPGHMESVLRPPWSGIEKSRDWDGEWKREPLKG